MGRLTPVYTAKQRAEAVKLVNEAGLRPQDAARLLEQGHNGLAPFSMPWETIRRYARDERQKQANQKTPSEKLADMVTRSIELAHLELEALEQAKKGDRDLARLARLVDIIGDLDKLKKSNPDKKPDKTPSALTSLPTTKAPSNAAEPKPTGKTNTRAREERDVTSGLVSLAGAASTAGQ